MSLLSYDNQATHGSNRDILNMSKIEAGFYQNL